MLIVKYKGIPTEWQVSELGFTYTSVLSLREQYGHS